MPDVKPQDQPQGFESFQSEKFMSIYSNSANLEVTPWDFKFVFGALVSQGQGKPPKIENKVEVLMSPQHAKVLLTLFANNLALYEKQVGEIKLPTPQPPAESPAPAVTRNAN